MSSVSSFDNKVSIKINNTHMDFCVDDIPDISTTTVELFKTFKNDPAVKLSSNLQVKAATLQSSIQRLNQAKSEDVVNKIFGVLRSALTTAILAGGIIGTVALAWCPPAAVGVGIATFIAYTAMCCYNAERAGFNLNTGSYADPFIWWIGGPFFPLYEEFGKVTRLEKKVQVQEKEVENCFADFLSFFGDDGNKMEHLLIQEIENLKVSLDGLKQLPSSTAAGEKEIQENLQKYEKALSELKKANSFCLQIQINTKND